MECLVDSQKRLLLVGVLNFFSHNVQHSNPKTGTSGAKQSANPPSNATPSKPSRPGTSSSVATAAEPVSPITSMGRAGDATVNNEAPAFMFQFGSLSPSFMHTSGMQLPARTSSAPPNLDEQKRDKARSERGAVVSALPAATLNQHQQQQSQDVKQAIGIKSTAVTPSMTLAPAPAPTPTPTSQLNSQSMVGGSSISSLQYPLAQSHNPYHQGQHPAVNLHMQVAPHLMQAEVHASQVGLRPSQGLMQQAPPSQGYHQALLPTTHSSQLHISPLPSQPIIAQIVSQTGSTLGTQLSTASRYGLAGSAAQYLQPRANKAVKIVNPETHEEVVFDKKAQTGDQFSANNASLAGRVSGNSSLHARPTGNYANTNYYSGLQTSNYDHSGQTTYHRATKPDSVSYAAATYMNPATVPNNAHPHSQHGTPAFISSDAVVPTSVAVVSSSKIEVATSIALVHDGTSIAASNMPTIPSFPNTVNPAKSTTVTPLTPSTSGSLLKFGDISAVELKSSKGHPVVSSSELHERTITSSNVTVAAKENATSSVPSLSGSKPQPSGSHPENLPITSVVEPHSTLETDSTIEVAKLSGLGLKENIKKRNKKEQRRKRMHPPSIQAPVSSLPDSPDNAITESEITTEVGSPAIEKVIPIVSNVKSASAVERVQKTEGTKTESSNKVQEGSNKSIRKKHSPHTPLVNNSKTLSENERTSPPTGASKDAEGDSLSIAEKNKIKSCEPTLHLEAGLSRSSENLKPLVVDGNNVKSQEEIGSEQKHIGKGLIEQPCLSPSELPGNVVVKSDARTKAEVVSLAFNTKSSAIERLQTGSVMVPSENLSAPHCVAASKTVEDQLIDTENGRINSSKFTSLLCDTGLGKPTENSEPVVVDVGENEKMQGIRDEPDVHNLRVCEDLSSNCHLLISPSGVCVDDKKVELSVKVKSDSVQAKKIINSETDNLKHLDGSAIELKTIDELSEAPKTNTFLGGMQESEVMRTTLPSAVVGDLFSKRLEDSVALQIAEEESQTESLDSGRIGNRDMVVNEINTKVCNESVYLDKTIIVETKSTEMSSSQVCLRETAQNENTVKLKPRLLVNSVSSLAGIKDESSRANIMHVSNPGVHNFSASLPVSSPEVKIGSKKKKKKELLAKADAAGATADLYNAYKAPSKSKSQDIRVTKALSELVEDKSCNFSVEEKSEVAVPKELDDWEDATELASITVSDTVVHLDYVKKDNCKYTRDFMLTFKDHCKIYPSDFEFRHDFVDFLANLPAFPSDISANYGRQMDRQYSSGLMLDRRNSSSSLMEDERWGKQTGVVSSPSPYGNRLNMDAGVIARIPMNPRSGLPPGMGLISPSLMGANPSLMRSSSDADRWQRAPSAQKGLMPSPHNHLPAIHKAEKKYEIAKTRDEEECKQRQIKSILNKLTPQNLERLFEQVKAVNIGSAYTLTGVISQIFDKALMEPTFCELYAKFCSQLAVELPEFNENGVKVTFKRVLLNKCQEEFERGQKEQEEAEKVGEEGEVEMSKEEREEKRLKAKRKMLGNIRFIGELYKKNMLTERIMHECIQNLFGEFENPDEEAIESLCKLMSTIGCTIDHAKAKNHMDAYFERIAKLSAHQKLPSRMRFMLKDVLDLRKMGWHERRKTEGPKKIEEVHRDAVQERQASVSQSSRMPRAMNSGSFLGKRGVVPPPLGNSGSIGVSRGVQSPQQLSPQLMRGSHSQDVRQLHSNDYRSRPTPLSQRPLDDASITLGPQGGLGRGMGTRGQTLTPGRSALADSPSLFSYNREEVAHRSLDHDKLLSSSDNRSVLDRSDRNRIGSSAIERTLQRTLSDRSAHFTTSFDMHQPQSMPSTPNVGRFSSGARPVRFTEEELKRKSVMAIREYFSARDLKEAAQCVFELECPEFHPNLVSIWITQSMEGKDALRDMDLLLDLITFLTESQQVLLKHEHVVKGFQHVLSLIEDTVADVPRAPDYLASFLGKLVIKEILSLQHAGQLLKDVSAEVGSFMQGEMCLRMFVGTVDTLRKLSTEDNMLRSYRNANLCIRDFVLPKDRDNGLVEAVLKDAGLLHMLESQV